MRFIRIVQTAAIALLLSACAAKMPQHTASLETINALKRSDMAPISVGDFKLAEGKPEQMDKVVTSRASSVTPTQGTVSAYLKDALISELKAAGKYDPAAPVSVTGELEQSELNTNIGTADGTLAATFNVADGTGATTYSKKLTARSQWEGSFIGAVAIPKAYQEYFALYKKLFLKLFTDPDFVRATKAEK